MSTGRTPIGSSPVLPSPDVLWKSSRRAMGPSSRAQRPNAFGKCASVCGQECCFVQDLPSKLSAASPRRHFLVSWVLTTVSTGYSQEESCPPQERELPIFIHHFPRGRGKEPLSKGSLYSRNMSGSYGNLAFGSKDRIWKKLCYFHMKTVKGFVGQPLYGWAGTAFIRYPHGEQPNLHIFLFTSKQVPLSSGHLAWLPPESKLN